MTEEDKQNVSVLMSKEDIEAIDRKAKKDTDNRSSVIRKIVRKELIKEGYL